MKKRIWGLVFFFILGVSVFGRLGWAASPAKIYTWDEKLYRGAMNVVSSPIEIAYGVHTTTEEKNLFVGWTVGLLKGFGNGFLRFAVGVVDVFTCPFNFPEGNKAPLIDPEFVWLKPGPKYI